MNQAEQLMKQYSEGMQRGIDQFLKYPWENETFYTNWLGQMYHFVVGSTRLIPFAASEFKLEHEMWHRRVVDHAKEEVGHQDLIETDLKHLGYDFKQFKEMPEMHILHQMPFRLIQTHGAFSLFGVSLYMEGLSLAAGKEITDRLIKCYGEQASQFMIVHTQEDETHIEEAVKMVMAAPEAYQEGIRLCFEMSEIVFTNLMKKIPTTESQTLNAGFSATDTFSNINI